MPQQLFILLITHFLSIGLLSYQNNFKSIGSASFYHDKFHNKTTASGEIYHKDSLTAAHPNLPFGTYVKVTNLSNQNSVTVRINDRGPFYNNRIIDVSKAAAIQLGMIKKGVIKVSLKVISTKEENHENRIEQDP